MSNEMNAKTSFSIHTLSSQDDGSAKASGVAPAFSAMCRRKFARTIAGSSPPRPNRSGTEDHGALLCWGAWAACSVELPEDWACSRAELRVGRCACVTERVLDRFAEDGQSESKIQMDILWVNERVLEVETGKKGGL